MATDDPYQSGDIEDITAGMSGLLGVGVPWTNNVPISVAKALLSKHETCEAWREGLAVTQEELDIALQKISTAFEHLAHRPNENETKLRFSAVEMVARRCIQASIHLTKEVEQVESVLTEADQLMQHCLRSKYISREYEDGLRYVLKSLEYSLDLAKSDGLWSAEKLAELEGHLESWDKMSVKNRAGVLALKQYVLGLLRHEVCMEQLEAVKKMVELDPDNMEWHYCLQMVVRYKRETADKYGPVTQEEKDAILRAMQCPGSSQHPRILNGYVSCLANIVRRESRTRSQGPIIFGTETFGSVSEAVALIRSYADTILAIEPTSVRFNVNIAKIFSSVLHRDYRDEDFARACLKRALIFRPDSSKASHRLGLLYLASKETLKAFKYMKKAYETDDRNFFALIDCLNILMADVKDNATMLDEYFSSSLDRPFFRRMSKNHTSLVLLKALYEYLVGHKEKSMSCFYDAFIQHADRTKEFFMDLPNNCSRFGWESNALGGDLLAGLRSAFYQELHASGDPSRERVFSALYETAGASGGRRAGPGRTGGGWDRDFHHRGGPRGGFGRSRGNEQQRNHYYESRGTGNGRGEKPKKNHSQPYTILGVSPTATKTEIKEAYYKMAMKCHPDKNTDLSHEEMLLKQAEMKLINKAWETLQD